jgi:hypothetical protein
MYRRKPKKLFAGDSKDIKKLKMNDDDIIILVHM